MINGVRNDFVYSIGDEIMNEENRNKLKRIIILAEEILRDLGEEQKDKKKKWEDLM